MLLYIVLYIVLAYLLLLTALINAVCLYNDYLFLTMIFENAFCSCPLSLGYRHMVCLLRMLSCIVYSANSQLVFFAL